MAVRSLDFSGLQNAFAQLQQRNEYERQRKEQERQRRHARNVQNAQTVGAILGMAVGAAFAPPGVGTAAGAQIGASIGGMIGGATQGEQPSSQQTIGLALQGIQTAEAYKERNQNAVNRQQGVNLLMSNTQQPPMQTTYAPGYQASIADSDRYGQTQYSTPQQQLNNVTNPYSDYSTPPSQYPVAQQVQTQQDSALLKQYNQLQAYAQNPKADLGVLAKAIKNYNTQIENQQNVKQIVSGEALFGKGKPGSQALYLVQSGESVQMIEGSQSEQPTSRELATQHFLQLSELHPFTRAQDIIKNMPEEERTFVPVQNLETHNKTRKTFLQNELENKAKQYAQQDENGRDQYEVLREMASQEQLNISALDTVYQTTYKEYQTQSFYPELIEIASLSDYKVRGQRAKKLFEQANRQGADVDSLNKDYKQLIEIEADTQKAILGREDLASKEIERKDDYANRDAKKAADDFQNKVDLQFKNNASKDPLGSPVDWSAKLLGIPSSTAINDVKNMVQLARDQQKSVNTSIFQKVAKTQNPLLTLLSSTSSCSVRTIQNILILLK